MAIVVVILAVLYSNAGSCARMKVYSQEKASTCPVQHAHKFAIQFPGQLNFTSIDNIIQFHGNFSVTEVIQEPLEMIIVSNRCTLDMKTCEQFNKVTLSDICRHINNEKGRWAPFFKSTDPDLSCPIKPGVYRFEHSILDLTFFTNFPMEGYRWLTYLKLYSKSKPKRELLCLTSQSSMRWVRKI
ncbi:uncharacterized protein LOC109420572 [Aedes albopictus]|uniref:MD-2-related lipid-recognition domain-containing protein n=1 Tax=Aedes albopictus TaxID=7160 RepID=A0ABM2A4L1_AEDAL